MKRIAVFSMLIAGIISGAGAATRGRTVNVAQTSDDTAVAARAATGARTAPRAATQTTQATNTVVRGRAATTTAAKPVVSARAATTQKVISTGTKVSSAAKNVVVSEECQAKYEGCMDAFCMLDNETGGRCICSDKNAEFDSILAEIEKLDQQSYKMATVGVERLEMGADADAAMGMAQSVADSLKEETEKSSTRSRRTLDLSMWDTSVDFDEDIDVFASSVDSIEGKEGDALYAAAAKLCAAQIPECSTEMTLMKTLYGQKIRSDCAAYENSLKQQRNASAQKLAAAEQALRQTALEQYRSANKYDLGQCTVQFKRCMQTTAGCGEDFSGCAAVAAMDETNVRKSTTRAAKPYQIKGAATTIEISASTYDTLMAKKPLCETVTKSCVNVASQVWDTFLREVAPQVKSAEIIAEDKARQDCVGNIASCFQKACKDTIDPNDPDGSYDICLTRPGTMLNLCKVPLNACGIDASSEAAASQSQIWDFVVARLASMRVDSCTTAVKECLQSDDRCGSDYSKCIGLDTDTIVRMCPYEKLVGCQQKYTETEIQGEDVYDELANMVQGIMLDIDNNMMQQCQNALNEAVIKVCGDTENCTALTVDDGTGERSFKYQICQYTAIEDNQIKWNGVCRDSLDGITEQDFSNPPKGVQGWAGKLSGTMYWGDIEYRCTTEGEKEVCGFTTEEEYIAALENAGYSLDDESRQIIKERVFGMEMRALTKAVTMAIDTIEADPTVQFCMSGRQVQGMKIKSEDGEKATRRDLSGGGRFPNLTAQTRRMIASAALKSARETYNKKYDAELTRMMQDQVKAAQRIDKQEAIKVAENTCAAWAESSVLPVSKAPKVSNVGKWIAVGLIAAAAIVGTVFTAGASNLAGAALIASIVGVSGATVTAAGIAIDTANKPVGQANVEQWNYKENVTTTFAPSSGVCTKVRVYQKCAKVKKNYCEKWADPVEIRDEVTLL